MAFPVGNRDILCVDWDERSLRVLDVSLARGSVKIKTAVHQPLPKGANIRDSQTMADFIRRTLGEHRIRTRRAIVDVPRHDVVLNRLSLPNGTTDELAAMVHMQIGKELPFNKEQAIIDFAVVPQKDGPTCDVWVAAMRANVLDYYKQVFAAAGLSLERIGLRPYANLVAMQQAGLADGRCIMVDVGPMMTEINIQLDGHLVYTRAASVNVPLEGLLPERKAVEPDESQEDLSSRVQRTPRRGAAMDNLLIEVNRTMAAYRATSPGASFDRIVLAGTAGISAQVVEVFQERFGTPTLQYHAPEKLNWRSDQDQSAAPFSTALGLALSNTADVRQHFDFLHVKEPEGEQRQRAKQRPVKAAVIALLALGALYAAYQPISERKSELAEVKEQIALINTDKKEREAFMDRFKQLKEWKEGDIVWIDHLDLLAEVFPSNQRCYITKAEFNNRGMMRLELAAVNTFVAAEVVEKVKSIETKVGEKTKHPFDARVAPSVAGTKDPKYAYADEVIIEINSR